MSFEMDERNMVEQELETALKNFRQSVHAWSEAELVRPRAVVRAGFWARMRKPIVAGALGCVVAVTAITVPVTVHQRNVAIAAHDAQLKEQQRLADAAAQGAAAVNDDKLLADVDSDIAQATPDALAPMASMMSDSTGK